MATVAFSIGSFGDITSILQIAWAVRGALAEAASAAVEIQHVVDDVDAFTHALQQIKATLESRGDQINSDIRNGITHSLNICDGVLRQVESRLSSYRQGLVRKHGSSWRKYWIMLAWSVLGGRKAADSLKQHLSGQIHAVHTYLALSQSNDQAQLLNLAKEQGIVLTRVYEVVEDISKRFDFGIPSFKFQDPFDGQYYLPMGRTSLQKLTELYELFTSERTCILDVPDNQTHRTMLIPIGFRYHPTLGDPTYAVVDCVIFRDAPFGQPQVLLSVPWLVERRCNLINANTYTPFYERTAVGKCASHARSAERAHMHFRACEQILLRQDIHFDQFWDSYRDRPLIELTCYYQRSREKPMNLLNKLEEPDAKSQGFIKYLCSMIYPEPGTAANRSVCFAMSPIVRLRQTTDCELLPYHLRKNVNSLLSKEFLHKVDKHSSLFDVEKGSELVWLCWAEELRRAILNIS